MNQTKKRMVVLCLALLIGGGWISIAARSADQPAEPAAPPQAGSFLADPNAVGLADTPLGGGGFFARMMLCILLVAILGAGMLYVSKRVLPRVANVSGKEIHVRETAYLGPRKALHLVEVGNRKLLIGSTNDSISTLADMTDTWLDESKPEPDNAVRL